MSNETNKYILRNFCSKKEEVLEVYEMKAIVEVLLENNEMLTRLIDIRDGKNKPILDKSKLKNPSMTWDSFALLLVTENEDDDK